MNDLPRHTLLRIIAAHGRVICDTPKRIEALLRDLCGAHRREINIIIGALEERVAADLMAASNSVPREVLLARLAARLRDNLAYTPEAARWGVETWAFALGIISEAKLRERARTESAEAERAAAPPVARDQKPPAPKSVSVNPQEAPQPQRGTNQPQRGTPYAPPPPHQQQQQQPAQLPQTRPSQPIARKPAPQPRRTPPVHPNIIMPEPPQQYVSPSLPVKQTSRRGLTLRGCLIFVVLIIVLIVAAIFVVPAVVFLLQEEQAQPRINDPRIR